MASRFTAATPIWCVIGGFLLIVALAGCSHSDRSSTHDQHKRSKSSTTSASRPVGWLGTNYNSSSDGLSLTELSRLGIVYDRDGQLETTAGQLARPDTSLGRGLSRSYAAGMIPDIVIDPAHGRLGCARNPNVVKLCLPSDSRYVAEYVQGFIATVRSVLSAHPGRRVLFEPMNEPWNWGSPPGTRPGKHAASEYAALLSHLLRATSQARLSLRRIYVPANGRLDDGTSWIPDLYRSQPCLRPGRDSCGPIEAWNVHPYGLPGSTGEGIGSVPALRAQMLSGENNLVVSEIGFCATDVVRDTQCDDNQSDIDGTSARTAHWLTATLSEAAPMHRAGWLKALIVWDRAQGGWGMQSQHGGLTAQGRALEAFAKSPAGR